MGPDPSKGRPRRFQGRGDLALAATEWGHREGATVVLLHGGGQTRHSWHLTGRRLAAAGFHAVALDARGHGDSQWAADADYTWTTMVDDLARVVTQLDAAVSLVGASAGGLTSLMATGIGAVDPDALVLVDVVVHLEDEGVNRVRAFMMANPDGFASVEEAAAVVASYLPGRQPRTDNSGLLKNLRRDESGRWRWHWDPRWLALGESRRDERFLIECARALSAPTLVVRGRQSDVVSREGVEHFLDLVPHASFADVNGAGHMVAGDNNDLFADIVVGFLQGALATPPSHH